MSKAIRIALVILITLTVCELVLRIAGYKPGVLVNGVTFTDCSNPQLVHTADSNGITLYIKNSPYLPAGYIVNNQGFTGNFDYTKEVIDSLKKTTGGKTILLIGDSYAEGCCLDSGQLSFARMLELDSSHPVVINMGIGGTDPLQYQLIAQKYIPQLKPDLVIVCVYLGNDVMDYNRLPHPGIPAFYRINDTVWVPSEPSLYFAAEYPNQRFATAQQAYDYNVRTFSLMDKNRNGIQTLMAQSVIVSRTYLFGRLALCALKNKRPLSLHPRHPYTAQHLLQIENIANASGSKLLIVAAPAIEDVMGKVNLQKEYEYVFDGVRWQAPIISNWSTADYNLADGGIHFSQQGHQKYFRFLRPLVHKALE